MIYLDNAATSEYRPVDDVIVDTMTNAMKEYWQNPSSLYATKVKEEINRCRANIANFIGAKADEIYFTSGASEANNWAIQGWIRGQHSALINIITTSIEHKSILQTVNNMASQCSVHYCKVDEFGFVDYQSLKDILANWSRHPKLVSIGFANNEIGTIQPIKEIADLVHQYDGVLHVDATQAFGHIPINVEELGIDLMSASGHKISSVLKGIGFLYKRNCINIQPLIYGAQENQMRGGTENTFSIIGLAKAVELCGINTQKHMELCGKRNHFIKLLEDKFDCELNGDSYYRLPNNINVTFPQNITGEALLYILDTSGIAIGVGSACNSQSIEPSYVLKAIGLTDEEAMRTVRLTLSNDITNEQIDQVNEQIEKAIKLIEI